MSNERPKITVQLPFGHSITLSEYITGHEWEELLHLYADAKKDGQEDDRAVSVRADKRLYEMLSVAIDGSANDPYDAVRQLPRAAYTLATNVISDVMNGEKLDSNGKKKSENSWSDTSLTAS